MITASLPISDGCSDAPNRNRRDPLMRGAIDVVNGSDDHEEQHAIVAAMSGHAHLFQRSASIFRGDRERNRTNARGR